jgi:hypothetical protein
MAQEDTLRTPTAEGCVSLCRLVACPPDLCDEIHRVCLEAQMLGWGMRSCLIGVVASNAPALAFWRSMGFEEVSEMAPMAGMLDRTIVMEKKLG